MDRVGILVKQPLVLVLEAGDAWYARHSRCHMPSSSCNWLSQLLLSLRMHRHTYRLSFIDLAHTRALRKWDAATAQYCRSMPPFFRTCRKQN